MAGYRGLQGGPGSNLGQIVKASGGNITTSGGYTIHTFTSNGTFTIESVRPLNSMFNLNASHPNLANMEVLIDFLLVGSGGPGGGLGSSTTVAGGGGAGGRVIEGTGIRIPIKYNDTTAGFPVVVGATVSGVGVLTNATVRGNASKFWTWIAEGGSSGDFPALGVGAAARLYLGNGNVGGHAGASRIFTTLPEYPVDPQGIDLDNRNVGGDFGGNSCGGGGSSAGTGTNGTSAQGGNGAQGVTSSIDGTSRVYGSGGGAGADDSGAAGTGGTNAGNGSTFGAGACTATSGTDGYGAGGGGAGEDNNSGTTGAGGRGTFIIRYLTV